MDITRAGSQPSRVPPAEYFTGTVRLDPLFGPPEPARVSGASVTFEPGARTAWHTGVDISCLVRLADGACIPATAAAPRQREPKSSYNSSS